MNYPPPLDMLQIPGPSLIEHADKDKTVRTAELGAPSRAL